MPKGLHLAMHQMSPHHFRPTFTLPNSTHDYSTPKLSSYFNQTPKLKSYAQHYTDKSLSSTFQRSQTQLDFNNLSLSPNTIKQKQSDVLDMKIKTLQEWGSRRNIRQEENIFKHRMKQLKNLQEKPQINNRSKELYRSVSKKRHLDKDVLNRFSFYESERVKKKIDSIVRTYMQQTKQVPSVKQLLRSNKREVVDLLRNIRG